MEKKYFYISLKHTKRNDAVFTFWGPNNAGYCYYKEWAGLYDVPYKNEKCVKSIDREIIDSLVETCIYDNKIVSFLLNNEANRRKLKITKKLLLDCGFSSVKRSHFIKFSDLKPAGKR
jgi:hypothetical protein